MSVIGILYVVLLVTAVWAYRAGEVGLPSSRRGLPRATLAAAVLVAVPSLVQLTVAPTLLGRLYRDRADIADGELWRLVTSFVVQDGGWTGFLFNLVFLVTVGVAAEQLWGHLRWCVVALVAGVGAELWGLLVQPVGGGNSVINFGLAASVAYVVLRRGAGSARVLAAISLLVGLVLLLLADIHGGAVVLGAATGAVLLSRPDLSGSRASAAARPPSRAHRR